MSSFSLYQPISPKLLGKGAIVAALSFTLASCGATTDLFQADEVLVEARQQVLERNVYNVSDDYRELKDKFNALERLYVELVHQIRTYNVQISDLERKLSNVKRDPQAAAQLTRVRADVAVVREQVKKLEGRVFSVEMSEQSDVFDPTGTQTSVVGGNEASTQLSNKPQVPVNNKAREQQVFYGVHLASYRSAEQVGSGWSGLTQAYQNDLKGLTPLIYTQSQEGIGTFLRLIAGPLISEQEASALCDRIRKIGTEQYCKVSEYQGEPIG